MSSRYRYAPFLAILRPFSPAAAPGKGERRDRRSVSSSPSLAHSLHPMNHRKSKPNFALLGAAGYVAPRHLSAIQQMGGKLLCATDPHDSVGILDRFFPQTRFFPGFDEFARHVDELKHQRTPVDYAAICSPNDLHDAHIRFALRSDADAICEKPLVISPDRLSPLLELCAKTGRKVHPILQLRQHSDLRALDEKVQATSEIHDVELTYITARGPWYLSSWKGDETRSGGLMTSIGIHFLDMLLWIFGPAERCDVHVRTKTTAAGSLRLQRAHVRWFLSIEQAHLPKRVRSRGKTTYRSIRLDGHEVEFSEQFEDLHTAVYRQILDGHGLSAEDARPAIELAQRVREADTSAQMPAWLTQVSA